MAHKKLEVLEYWNNPDVESMYDKHLLNAEIDLIKAQIKEGTKILDAGCGEGEGTLVYASINNTQVHAVDFSETRLSKAKERLNNLQNVTLKQVDFLGEYILDNDFDFVISQRFLINLMEWDLQKKVILDLTKCLKTGGRLLMFEGSEDGVQQLNTFRSLFDLPPIEVKWHNLFFKNELLLPFFKENNLHLTDKKGLGEYFLLTRGIRPIFEKQLDWNNTFNEVAARSTIQNILKLNDTCSRLILWIIEKQQICW